MEATLNECPKSGCSERACSVRIWVTVTDLTPTDNSEIGDLPRLTPTILFIDPRDQWSAWQVGSVP